MKVVLPIPMGNQSIHIGSIIHLSERAPQGARGGVCSAVLDALGRAKDLPVGKVVAARPLAHLPPARAAWVEPGCATKELVTVGRNRMKQRAARWVRHHGLGLLSSTCSQLFFFLSYYYQHISKPYWDTI